jgi:hypothetical protein
VGAGEPRADIDYSSIEVDIAPDQAEQLGDPDTGLDGY